MTVATDPPDKPRPPKSDVPVIELVDLHKRFGKLVVLDGVSICLEEARTNVIIGESGTGKSVLLKHIVGLLKPDSGQVYFRGERIDNIPDKRLARIRRHFGFLFQLSALFDSATAGENVAFPLVERTPRTREEINRIVKEKLRMVGLSDVEHKMPAELSGGQKKRVALARAISLDPSVILYDEPTTGLDPVRADVINELILKLKREMNVTSIVVTHDMPSVFKIADRVLMLHEGKIIFDGTCDEIRTTGNPRVQRFVQGRADEEDLRSLEEYHK